MRHAANYRHAATYRHSADPSAEWLCNYYGSSNWVHARRTRRIVERYGDDVVCVSPKMYRAACDAFVAQATANAA